MTPGSGEEHPVVTKFKDDPPPRPDLEIEAVDSHRGPLDNPDDAQFLDPTDPRRVKVEVKRGKRFD